MLTSDLAFLVPITILLVIAAVGMLGLELVERRDRRKRRQLSLPLEKSSRTR